MVKFKVINLKKQLMEIYFFTNFLLLNKLLNGKME